MTRADLTDIGLQLLGIALAFAILAVPLDGVLEKLLTASGGMIALCWLALLGRGGDPVKWEFLELDSIEALLIHVQFT